MAFCTFSDGAAMFDATPIENLFLLEYMYDAPEQALKVYLYARMLALHPELGGSAADMAKALRLTEDEVVAALRYWETRALVVRRSDNPPTYQLMPLRTQVPGDAGALDREIYANRDFNNRLQRLFGNALIDQRDLNKASDWVNLLHYERDAVVRLVEYGIATSRSRSPKPASVFKRMDALAEEWSQKGIRTLQDVERAAAGENATGIAKDTLKKLGIGRPPTDEELALVRRWTDEWGYSREQIIAACARTVSARNPTLKYLDSILSSQRTEDSDRFAALSQVLRELNPQSARPTPDQMKRYSALLEAGFAPELIRLAAVQCHRMNKDRFDDLEWRLDIWRKDGVTTPEEAENYMRLMSALSRELREVFRRAGVEERRPNYGQLETYRGWKERYPDELIAFAAECARNAGGSMAYMDRLLTEWAQAGADTVEAARAQREARRAGRARDGEKPANPALDYQQREYRDEDFGDDFFVDLSKYAEEGDA